MYLHYVWVKMQEPKMVWLEDIAESVFLRNPKFGSIPTGYILVILWCWFTIFATQIISSFQMKSGKPLPVYMDCSQRPRYASGVTA